ncbi:MAG: DUF423 domain-containing protein [Planctomycetes bacterium]|nr:DUF423 domain-containing protein [Planctomycetota bacterium]
MQATTCLRLSAFAGASAVALGAFAAHGMKGAYDVLALQTFETGVRYQMYHALALGLCAALAHAGWRITAPALGFLVGIVLFSGSLYGLVLLEARWLGPVTPVGGVAFVVGWAALLRAGPGAGGFSADRRGA